VAHALNNESGNIEFVGAVTDTTESKRTEEALRLSEAYLAEGQRLSHTGSWHWNVRTGEVVWSQEAFAIFGFDPEKTKASYPLFLERVHPEDRSQLDELLWAAVRDKRDFEGEYRVLLPGGLIKYMHSIGRCSLGQSGDIEYSGVAMDITERKRAEQALAKSEKRWRAIFETSAIGVALMDMDTRFIAANSAYQKMLGYTEAELRSLTSLDVTHEDYHHLNLKQIEDLKHGTKSQFQIEKQYKRKDGSSVWVKNNVSLVPGSEMVPQFIMALSEDITERKRAEEERERLRRAEADLAHINRVSTMGELTASLAHEIKQPISAAATNAKTCLRWLRRDQPDVAEAQEAASRLVKDVTRASDIISRIGSLFKKDTLQRELVHVDGLIDEMIALLRSEAARYSISIHADVIEDLPQIMADRIQLQQVFMNLMLNGIEAMKDMGTPGRLTINAQRYENRQLLVSVSDTGMGLLPEQTEQIFNAFFTSKPQGTGMGLPISRSIIESHGGRLWATSNAGPGATFQFTLPMEHVAHEVA
jgi:PAS domain S-box-containing protein